MKIKRFYIQNSSRDVHWNLICLVKKLLLWSFIFLGAGTCSAPRAPTQLNRNILIKKSIGFLKSKGLERQKIKYCAFIPLLYNYVILFRYLLWKQRKTYFVIVLFILIYFRTDFDLLKRKPNGMVKNIATVD